MSALDVQEGGGHYKSMKIQPVVFCMANGLDTCQSNIIKYVCRHDSKNGLEDLKKALHYLELWMEFKYGRDQSSPREGQACSQTA